MDLVEVDDKAEQVEVQRAQHEIEHRACRAHLPRRRHWAELDRKPQEAIRMALEIAGESTSSVCPSVGGKMCIGERAEERAQRAAPWPPGAYPGYVQHHLCQVHVETKERKVKLVQDEVQDPATAAGRRGEGDF